MCPGRNPRGLVKVTDSAMDSGLAAEWRRELERIPDRRSRQGMAYQCDSRSNNFRKDPTIQQCERYWPRHHTHMNK